MTPSDRAVASLIEGLRAHPKNVRYSDVYRVCVQRFGGHSFGEPRQSGGSHTVFAMPWAGDPRVNIQNDHGRAKVYQVRQVLAAIDKLSEGNR